MKKIPYLQIVIVLAVIVAVIYVIKTYVLTGTSNDNNSGSSSSSGTKNQSSPGTSSSASASSSTPPVSASGLPIKGNTTVLKRGDKAAEVKYIQFYYNQNFVNAFGNEDHLTPLVEDGVFGEKTEAAVKLFTNKTSASWKEFHDAVDAHVETSVNAYIGNNVPDWMKIW